MSDQTQHFAALNHRIGNQPAVQRGLPRLSRKVLTSAAPYAHYYVMRNSTRSVANQARAEHFSDPPLLVLASLADGPKHGYAMIDEIERMSGARLGPGTLYGAITRLEQQGLIEPLAVEERRQPYRLTTAGRQMLRAKLVAMRQVALMGLRKLEIQ